MDVLILDSQKEETESFFNGLDISKSIKVTDNISEFEDWLSESSQAIVFLDHDLDFDEVDQISSRLKSEPTRYKRIFVSAQMEVKDFHVHQQGGNASDAYLKKPLDSEGVLETIEDLEESFQYEYEEHTLVDTSGLELEAREDNIKSDPTFTSLEEVEKDKDFQSLDEADEFKIEDAATIIGSSSEFSSDEISVGDIPHDEPEVSVDDDIGINLGEASDLIDLEENNESKSDINQNIIEEIFLGDDSDSEYKISEDIHFQGDEQENDLSQKIEVDFYDNEREEFVFERSENVSTDEEDFLIVQDDEREDFSDLIEPSIGLVAAQVASNPTIQRDQMESLEDEVNYSDDIISNDSSFEVDYTMATQVASDLDLLQPDEAKINLHNEISNNDQALGPDEKKGIIESVKSIFTKKDGDEFMAYHNDELVKLQATIKNLREDRDRIQKENDQLMLEKDHIDRKMLTYNSELDELKIENAILKKSVNELGEEVKHQRRMSEDKNSRLIQKNKTYQEEFDRLNHKVRVDFNKIREKEKTLENQLELLKEDTRAQIESRENKILELKRKIDSLEFNMESVSRREKDSRHDKFSLESKIDKVIKTLRLSLEMLESDELTDDEKEVIYKLKNLGS